MIRKKFMYILFVMGATVVFISEACKNEYVQQDPVCFERDVYPIIQSNCAQSNCHNSVDRVSRRDYTTYEGILRDVQPGNYRASSLYQIVASSSATMPPKPYNKLSDDQILVLASWIEEGALNDTCSMATTCDTAGVISYTSQVKPLLANWCNSCHGGTAQAGGGISLSSYAAVKATVDNKRLVGSVVQSSGYSAMPKNGNKLSNCNIATIKKWAEAGAPNN